MSIFDRLFDIAKANLNHAMPGRKPLFGGRNPGDDSERRAWRQKSHWEQADPQPKNNDFDNHAAGHEDPILAQYYANLEIPYGSDLTTAKKAWKKLMRQYHPDRHASDPEKRQLAEELTQNLNRAYSELEKHLGGQSKK